MLDSAGLATPHAHQLTNQSHHLTNQSHHLTNQSHHLTNQSPAVISQVEHMNAHKLFEKLTDEELENDLSYKLIQNSSEESQKVSRNAGSKWSAAYRRISLEAAKAKFGIL
jgi:hypothetical protein